jgi:hypothetical protein
MSKEPFDVTPWVVGVAGGLIGLGVYHFWGWAGLAIATGLMLFMWVKAATGPI